MTELVLLHGFSQTGASWNEVAAKLPGAVIHTPDLAGHGAHADVAADLWGHADLLAATCGPGVYVGYSMGARVALHLALRHPHLVQALVVLGGTAGIDDPAERRARRLADDALARSIELRGVTAFLDSWLAQPMFAALQLTDDDRRARQRNTATGLASALRLAGTGTQTPPLWDRLHEITVPTLVLAGAHDTKFTALGVRMADAIGDNAKFATVADAGHAAHTAQPDAFATLVQSWLDGLGRRFSGSAT